MALSEAGAKQRSHSANMMTIPEMFKVATRSNQAWGVEGYDVPRKYADPRPNKLYEKKGVKDEDKKKLKKGDYLSYTLKVAATLPAPNAFQTPISWVDEKLKNKPKVKVGDRITYVEKIFKDSKLRSVPGPGAYNLRKDPKEEAKAKTQTKIDKDKIPVRQNFLCEVEFVADKTPGPGSYYPRTEISKLKESKPNREDVKKSRAGKKKADKQIDGYHYNPLSAEFDTFGKLEADIKEKKAGRKREKSMDNSKRFPDEKKEKERSGSVPGPGHYQMIANWPGKPEKAKKDDAKVKDWMKLVSKGIEKSIYYS